jgi:signal transduction histidine kinase
VLHLRPSALAPLLRESLAANQGYAERAGVKLHCELPEPASLAQAQVDADRFLQIMANLLSNAIKHTPRGLQVTVRLSASAEQLCVSVADEGPGIDPEFRPRMFEKFSQADGSDRRPQGGTGLGLYLTRVLVERMQGRIEVASTPGQGAVFSVSLPRIGLASPSL